VRIRELPFTPEKVYRALHAARHVEAGDSSKPSSSDVRSVHA
jgi:hypothetical protein